MNHDAIHYFTIFMLFIFIPGTFLAGLGSIAWSLRSMIRDRNDTERMSRMKRQFREAYTLWKKAESENDGSAYIHRQNAEWFAIELDIRQA